VRRVLLERENDLQHDRRQTIEIANTTYQIISESLVPDGLTWDIPRQNQGQMVKVSYGNYGRGSPDVGSLYRCTIDRSVGAGAAVYARRVGPEWVPS
jgi:hypothetical protein